MLTQLRKGLALLPPRLRVQWFLLVPLMLLVAASEAVGAAAVFGLVRVVTDPSTLDRIPLVSGLIRSGPWQDDRSIILFCTLLVAVFYLSKNVLVLLTEVIRGRCTAGAVRAVSLHLLAVYLRAPYSFHLRRNSAELIRNLEYAVHQVFLRGLAPLVTVISEVLVVAALLAVLLVAAPQATLAAGGILLAVSALFLRATRNRARREGERLQTLSGETLRHAQQALAAIKEVRLLGRETFFLDAYRRPLDGLTRARRLNAILAAVPRVLVETVFITGALVVIVLVTLRGATGPDAVSVLGLFAYAGFRIIPSANRILWQLTEARYGTAAVDEVYADFVSLSAAEARRGSVHVPSLQSTLTLENVTYTYDGASKSALQGLNLTIRKGESIGIVGATGAGKSTLADLLLGLLPVTSGRVLVDGTNLPADRGNILPRAGYVPQRVLLLDDTIRRNIALGIPDKDIDEDALRRALTLAQLDGFVGSLADGLDTLVGEAGTRLSGGERQRIGIARALYEDPDLLVFDEATAALDNQTERALIDGLRALRGTTTMVFIAHRLSTVEFCDRLVMLQEGRIHAVGSYAELLEHSPAFRALAGTSRFST